MRASPVDLIGGYYKSDSLPWACQDTVNWLPVMAEVEGTRSLKMLETPPGLKPYQQIGTGPIRGMHDCEGLRLIVSGRYLYRITNAGVGVPIGVIPGVGRVSMTHNQFETGYQVLVENGQPGGGYVYSTVDQTFVRITDEGYPGSISSDYLDSYTLGVEPFGRFWFHSDLANSTSYNAIDRAEAESSPDKIVGLKVIGDEVAVFGQRTTDFFYNTGAATGTFQNRRQSLQRGCASRDTIARMDNSLLWLGDDGIVYRLGNGYTAQPVSTRSLEQQIAKYNLAQAFAFVWEDRGHKVYYLTFPDGQTFGYDVVTGLWHRRESFGLDRWRLTHVVEWSGKKYGGDFQTGRVWLIDWEYHLEGSQPIISERVSPVLSDNQSRLGIPSAELVFDTGQGPGTVAIPFPAQPSSPVLNGDAPDSLRNIAYPAFSYTVTGGEAPFSISVVEGVLPAGLSLTSSGAISGVATTLGASSFTLRVTDKKGLWTERVDSIGISTQVLALGASSGTRMVDRRLMSGTWANVNTGPAATSTNLAGLAGGRFIAWVAGAAYYSDDDGSSWTKSSSVIDSSGGIRSGDSLGSLVVLGGGSGAFYVSANGGTTYLTKAAPTTFLGSPLLVKSGPFTGRILLVTAFPATSSSYTDDQGATFSAAPAHGVTRSSGGAAHSRADMQYIGGNVAAGGKPRLAVIKDGSTLVRNLTLTGAANGFISAILAYPLGDTVRLLMGTSTGELWASDDNGVTASKVNLLATGQINGLVFDGVRVLVGVLSTSSMIQSSSNDGATWATEPNPSLSGITAMSGAM
ncbi:putative Ig domain-containing protein [Stenotrophomonas sp. NPDC078853]|uniref:putative Ig domain-containing protein n=1 Tax=Stenotrophomonas sp. NPDC078853 TaxID=3364534 RepID=UPI00385095AC